MTSGVTSKEHSVEALHDRPIAGWDDIGAALDELEAREYPTADGAFEERLAGGIAFVTFAYDIDGVTIEIAKYATCLERLFAGRGRTATIHCIAGAFHDKADLVLDSRWNRVLLPGTDGWGKWADGRWFATLFRDDMPEDSDVSRAMAGEIWQQAVHLAGKLCRRIEEHGIGLLVPVNVNSNPGNLAFALAIALASEVSGCPVLNNSHDFYWEGGCSASERDPGDPPGPRDHFFRNESNASFFRLFERLLPYRGRRWLHVNINRLQSSTLAARFGLPEERLAEIGTLIDDTFFAECSAEEKRTNRVRMAHILSGGTPLISPVPIAAFLADVGAWMRRQRPIVCGAHAGLTHDMARDGAIYFLQPTRVVERKRIERDWALIGALLEQPEFRAEFEAREEMTITLHVTGPVPIEHREDLGRVLHAYRRVLERVPESIGRRLFQAFSVGTEDHPSLHENGLGKLNIAGIYTLADMVLFPSYTEGRGLPIVETAAIGVPIVCSRYHPEEVFAEVVGEHLPESRRIIYDLFPEGEFTDEFLRTVARNILEPDALAERIRHNREAVRERHSMEAMERSFAELLDRLERIV